MATRLEAPENAFIGRAEELSRLEALRGAAWSGERISAEAAANRVYVALSWLRREGLDALLVRSGDGWLLDPAVPVQRVSAVPSSSPARSPRRQST